jgi:hypothetical protein
MEINQPSTLGWDRTLLEGLPILKQCRWPNAVMINRARHPVAQEELATNFANTHESGNRKDSLFRVDSRSVFFGHIDFTDYIDFADTAEFKGKQKVPHSCSRALPIHAKSGREREPENARFANGVRDDET